MSRQQAKWAVSLTVIILFAAALWQTMQHWAWLEARHLAGIVSLDLIGLGVLVFAIPLHLNSQPETIPPGKMVRDVLVRGVLALLAFTAVGGVFVLIGFLLSIPARLERPYLLLPALLLLVPVGLAAIDFLTGSMQRTPGNLFWRWLRHGTFLYGMLLLQFGVVITLVLVYPLGIGLHLVTVVQELVYFLGDPGSASLPTICRWLKAGPAVCPAVLVSFHAGHLALLILVTKFGEQIFDGTIDQYKAGLDWLEERVAK